VTRSTVSASSRGHRGRRRLPGGSSRISRASKGAADDGLFGVIAQLGGGEVAEYVVVVSRPGLSQRGSWRPSRVRPGRVDDPRVESPQRGPTISVQIFTVGILVKSSLKAVHDEFFSQSRGTRKDRPLEAHVSNINTVEQSAEGQLRAFCTSQVPRVALTLLVMSEADV